jgi:hypothetical protein
MTGHNSTALILTPGLAAMQQLEIHFQSRLNGWLQHFQLVDHGCCLILNGHAHTYYAKQFAQHAVLEATALPILANEIDVSCHATTRHGSWPCRVAD